MNGFQIVSEVLLHESKFVIRSITQLKEIIHQNFETYKRMAMGKRITDIAPMNMPSMIYKGIEVHGYVTLNNVRKQAGFKDMPAKLIAGCEMLMMAKQSMMKEWWNYNLICEVRLNKGIIVGYGKTEVDDNSPYFKGSQGF